MRLFIIFAIPVLITSCAPSQFFMSDGSRSDGTVELACNYNMLQGCQLTGTPEAHHMARQACRNWGYDGAQSFGSYNNRPKPDGSGQVKIMYQCTGDPEK